MTESIFQRLESYLGFTYSFSAHLLICFIFFVDFKAELEGGAIPANPLKGCQRISEPVNFCLSFQLDCLNSSETQCIHFLFFPILVNKDHYIFIEKAKYNYNINP